ncbi:TPA: hypothetical protein UL931_000228 [Stenotrophomonas maltophilia]|nr:hypothetical protein [Stenotrophomonas maltophilia]
MMKRDRSTGNKTKTQRAKFDAIRDIDRIAYRRTYVRSDGVRAEFWGMAGQNRRMA